MSRPDVAAILVAGGSSTRFGTPKQFEMIGGLPMYQYVARTFSRINSIGRIVLVGPATYLSEMKAGMASIGIHTDWAVVEGGETRQESVSNGLASLTNCEHVSIVIVHDVARALIEEATINSVIDAIREHGAAIAAIPVVDTLKRILDGVVEGTVSRENLWRAQTPQGARIELLRNAFRHAANARHIGTDEAELLEKSGVKPRIVEGSERNFKLTYRHDLERARAILASED